MAQKGSEGHEDAEEHSCQIEKQPSCKGGKEDTLQDQHCLPCSQAQVFQTLSIPLLLSLSHLAMGQILEIFHVAQLLQSGHIRKAPSWPRSLPCELKLPILGRAVLNQPAVLAHPAHPPAPSSSHSWCVGTHGNKARDKDQGAHKGSRQAVQKPEEVTKSVSHHHCT